MPADLRTITDFSDLLAYLRDELHWPVEDYALDDLTFEYDADELGLKDEEAEKLKDGTIRQLRPLPGGQPFGIFFVEFGAAKLPVVVLRRILNALVIKKRNSANPADRQRWDAADILFISAFGESDDREIAFAHFHKDPDTTEIPILRVLGWDGSDTPLKTKHVAEVLKNRLHWPENPADQDSWRKQWRGAFRHRLGHVIKTSSDLADALAHFARKIRDAATTIIAHESEAKGHLRKLHRAFQSALIHDLTEEAFADTYSQTVTYGLLTAAISKTPPDAAAMAPAEQTALTQEDITAMVPVTNPFLKEMLQEFLKVGGRKGGVDFDELGINEVVELLRGGETDLPAILRDFGNRKPGEDPVIHFYETFLTAYNKKLKIQRGVFYTPNPVVSYIIRSVDELLKSEFHLEHGLADTITWGEFISRTVGVSPTISLPPLTDEPGCTETISPDEFFVQILDPATGTATFPVEIIDVIFKYLKNLWKERGAAAMPRIPLPENCKLNTENFAAWWNCYVPYALLPRLHGYELMMAPYAIAHMKIGLKLAETGYRFQSEERARIFLTNALEPWQQQLPLIGFDALAHEAEAVNEIKRHKRFTVVVGNPPYSKISSNLTPEMRATVERYRYLNGEKIKERGALQFEINLQDDYVKFFRLCEGEIGTSNIGIVGLITNNGYLSTPTLRGMRDSLLETFNSMWVLDLHGHLAKREIGSDGAQEENVFDIVQGVAVFLGDRKQPKTDDGVVFHSERYGSREGKYSFLQSLDRASTNFAKIAPSPPFYLFVPHDSDLALEWKQYVGLAELFPKNSAGIITARDSLVIAESKRELAERLERFCHAKGTDSSIYAEFGFSASKRFDLREAQTQLRKLKSFSEPIRRMLHRPFDQRFVYFERSVVWSLSRPMAEQMEDGTNLALVATRQVTRPQFEHAYVSRHIIEIKACSHDRNTQIFPLFICGTSGELALSSGVTPNLNPKVLGKLAKALGLELISTRQLGNDDELTPIRLFHYSYAILHCPRYRERYFEFLRSDFPRVPLTGSLALFRELSRLGGELVALHLLESPKLDTPITEFIQGSAGVSPASSSAGGQDARAPLVTKPGWTPGDGGTVWLDSGGKKAATTPGTCGFHGVPENVWNFHIGGYQVCEKWLKDRKGRTLTAEDIAHYHKIVIALSETIRLMAEIDQVIESHGGWPGAFQPATVTAAP